MEYSVGSLAELISGKKTPNKSKVVQKAFTPIKQEEVSHITQAKENVSKGKSPKKFNASPSKSKQKPKKNLRKSPENSFLENPNNTKGKKRKLEPQEAPISEDNSSKKQKLSKNEHNAASRIKNKINQETKNSAGYNNRTVFVGNIPVNIKKQKIKKLFRKYGPIESVRIRGIAVPDIKTSKKVAAIKKEFHPDRNTFYAFIRYVNPEDCKKAEAENGQLFENHHLRVHACESSDKPDEAKAIFVGNLAFNAEEEELWELFKSCGTISHVRIVRDGRTGMGKGFGYVNFKDSDSVQLALEMEKPCLKNRELRISMCNSNRAQKIKTGKKPRHKSRVSKEEQSSEQNDANSNKADKISNKKFSGTKFNDKKKKKNISKTVLEKKKLSKKLLAPQTKP